MPYESLLVGACDRVPEADGIVVAPTGERPAIRTERYAIDRPRVPFERVFVCACDRVPQADGAPAPTGERPAVRTERYAVDII